MSLFEKTPKQNKFATGQGQSFSGPSPSSPRPGPIPPRFDPSSRPIPSFRRPVAANKKIPPPKPETLFGKGKKKEYERDEFLKKIAKDPIPFSGKWEDQRKKMFGEAFPKKEFGSYISEGEVRKELKKLKKEGYRAKKLRDVLEKRTGLK